MLTHETEVIRLLHRERMERLGRAARGRPATEPLAEREPTTRPARFARIALHVRRWQLRLREDA
jgi:hypothetical protein